jgi:dTDP-4-amino-4,6-dideoxygalactose transaminase
MIPQAAPDRRIARFRGEIDAAIARVVMSPAYILGPEVAAFERAFADYLGVRMAIAVNSGTDALVLALRAAGAGPGTEVITTSMSASATGIAILLTGATPRFVDIDARSRCLEPGLISAAVTERTVAIVPVHLYGQPADMPAIVEIAHRNGLLVVEDCAQAHGAHIDDRKVGTFGDLAAFSFYPTKNLGCIGDGGLVATGSENLANTVRSLRQYGWSGRRHVSDRIGYNSRLDELQAAILRTLLPHLDDSNRERCRNAEVYSMILSPLQDEWHVILPAQCDGAVHHQYCIEVDNRAAVIAHLAQAGIGSGIHYEIPIHRQPAFHDCATPALPNTDALARRTLSLPIQPEVVGEDARRIAGLVFEAIRACTK